MSSLPLAETWRATVRRNPTAWAVMDAEAGEPWSRAALADRANAWGTAWATGRPFARRRVLLCEPNGPRWFEVFLALVQSDAIPVPVDSGESADAMDRLARAVGAAWIWHQGVLRPGTGGTRMRPADRDTALIKLTSGSTGVPKALRFTAAQLLADGRQVCASMGIGPDDRNLAAIPLGHSYGLGNVVIPLLTQGSPSITLSMPLPRLIAHAVATWKATVFPTVPALLRALLASDLPTEALRPVRLIVSAGAALPPATAQGVADRFGLRVHSFYGSSETGGIAYDRSGDAALTGRSVGTPLEGVTVELIRGRLRVRSGAVMTPGVFSPPDRAALNPQGEIVLQGRVGRTVKVAGRRLDLGEVENALRARPQVEEAVVLPDPRRVDSMVAVVATRLAPRVLRESLAAVLASWKIPDRWVLLDELPRTARGKVDRAALVALVSREPTASS